MDDFQKANLKEYDRFDLRDKGHSSPWRISTRWWKRKSNHIARQKLKERVRKEGENNG